MKGAGEEILADIDATLAFPPDQHAVVAEQ